MVKDSLATFKLNGIVCRQKNDSDKKAPTGAFDVLVQAVPESCLAHPASTDEPLPGRSLFEDPVGARCMFYVDFLSAGSCLAS